MPVAADTTVPLLEDLSDAAEKVQWMKDNDAEARQIVRNAREFVRRRLYPEALLCFHFTALQEYAQLQQFQPQVRDGMELAWAASQNATAGCACANVESLSKRSKSTLSSDGGRDGEL